MEKSINYNSHYAPTEDASSETPELLVNKWIVISYERGTCDTIRRIPKHMEIKVVFTAQYFIVKRLMQIEDWLLMVENINLVNSLKCNMCIGETVW